MPPRTRATSSGKSASAPSAEARKKSAEPATTEAAAADTAPAATLNLPFLSAQVAIPGSGVSVKAGPVNVSLPTRYLYYGGLGALTVVGAVEWPIAGALAATGLVIDRMRKPTTAQPETGVRPTPAHT